MAGETRALANGATFIDFQTEPSRYRHWKLTVDGEVATLSMDVDENGGLFRQKPRVLRRRQYPDARGIDACAQGELLQVHQRDPQRY
jgi:hypothetical protein